MLRRVSLSILVASLLVAGCDRKAEPTADEPSNENSVAPLQATNTTVIAVDTPGPDAGPDATTTVVGVSLTTIVQTGHPSVVEGLARARCEREQRCNNIGFEKSYSTLDACLTKIATDWRDELNRYECPGGFEQKELDECMREIRSEDCSRPFDTLERIVACRSGDICIATP